MPPRTTKTTYGGPAFPQPIAAIGDVIYEVGEKYPWHMGMSLRDYFAAFAVQSVSCGIIAEADHGTTAESLAATAYRIADAMLAARKETQ